MWYFFYPANKGILPYSELTMNVERKIVEETSLSRHTYIGSITNVQHMHCNIKPHININMTWGIKTFFELST